MKRKLLLITVISLIYTSSPAVENFLIPYYDGKIWGFCDTNMKPVVTPKYDSCGEMIDEMAWVKKDGKYGFIDSTGKEVITPVYKFAENFVKGFSKVTLNEKYGVIDKNGKFVIPLTDYYISGFNGTAAVISKDYIYGLMGEGGKIILPPKYKSLSIMNSSFFIAAEGNKTNSFMLLNSKGEVVSKSYDLIYPLDSGFARIQINSKWGYIDSTGKEIVPPVYDDIRNIKPDGSACFFKNQKWGIINGRGEIVKEPVYDNVGGGNSYYDELFHYNEKFFAVYSGNKWGTVSPDGRVLAKPEYYMFGYSITEYLPAYKMLTKSDNSQATVLTILDKKGSELFTPLTEYKKVGTVSEDLVSVGNSYGMWGYINLKGETVIKPEYEEAREFMNGLAIVKKNGLYGLINKTNEIVEDFVFSELKISDNYPGLYAAEISGKTLFLKPGTFHYWK